MSYRLRGWLLIASVILFCGGVILVVSRSRARVVDSQEGLLERLPQRDAVVVAIDFAALRRAGLMDLLARSRTPEEPDYKQFVARTDFDYKQDLDLALASFGPAGEYFLLKGRFDWAKLSAYARTQQGECVNTFCKMAGSTPEHKISFFPLQTKLMALGVATDPDAAARLATPTSQPRRVPLPSDPIWISFPPAAIRESDKLPQGTRMFAKSMEDADEAMLSLGPKGQDFQATLTVLCKSDHDAEVLAAELERTTALLRSMIEREKRTPNPNDLSGVLTSGTFSREARRVSGHWPIAHGFVEDALTGGM